MGKKVNPDYSKAADRHVKRVMKNKLIVSTRDIERAMRKAFVAGCIFQETITEQG